MRSSTIKMMLASSVALVALLTSCGGRQLGKYREGIAENQSAVQTLRLGMSPSEVRQIMGEGEVVRYKKLHLIDPWRSESFALVDGSRVLILFYVTEPPRKYYSPDDRALTPVIFENDRLVGWGWSYLRQNTDRYRITLPREM